MRKLSHRSFVTDQTSRSQDSDPSPLRQLTHSSLCALAPFLLEASGGCSLLGRLPFPPVCFLLQLPPGVWLGLSCCCRVSNNFLRWWLLPCSYRNNSLKELGLAGGEGRVRMVTLSFLLSLLSNTQLVKGSKTTTSMRPPTPHQAPVPMCHGLGSSGSSLWHGAEWAGHLCRIGPCGQERRKAGWGRGEVTEQWGLTRLTRTHGALRTQDCLLRTKWPELLPRPWPVVKCGPHGKGVILGKAALQLRQLLQGPQLQAVCVPHSWQLGNMSFLERRSGWYNSISGCWDNTVKTESSLLQRFLANCINILRSSIIIGDAWGKSSQKHGSAKPLGKWNCSHSVLLVHSLSYNKPRGHHRRGGDMTWQMQCSLQIWAFGGGVLSADLLTFQNQHMKILIWMWHFCGGLERALTWESGNHGSSPAFAPPLTALWHWPLWASVSSSVRWGNLAWRGLWSPPA